MVEREIKYLSELCDIKTGKKDANHAVPDGIYRFYTCSNQYSMCNTKSFSGPCVIVPGNGDIGLVFYYDGEFEAYQRTYVLHNIKINPKYLYYHLCHKWRIRNSDKQFGSTVRYVRMGNFTSYEVPVPPLSEQERIVARIEELFSQLDAGVETLKKIKVQLAIYRQAVLKEAFEGIETFIPLEKITIRVFDGPFGTNLKTADYTDSGVRVVRLENLKNAWFDDTKKSFVTFEKYESIKAHTVFPFDLIMSTFISDSIKICQLPPYIGYAVNKADCVGIRLKAEIIPHFIMYYMSSRRAYNDLVNQVHGATRPRVNTSQIKVLNVPIVEVKKQEIIVSKIESSLSVCDNIEQTVDASLQQADALRQSILKDAFEGRL